MNDIIYSLLGKTDLTVNELLYGLLTIPCVWLTVQLVIAGIRRLALEQWKPNPKNIYYEIKNNEERCIVSGMEMREPGEQPKYYLEFKSVDSGYIVKRKIVKLANYERYINCNVFTRKQSEIIFYALAPNDTVLKYRKVLSNDNDDYHKFSEEDINNAMVEEVKKFFIKTKPKKHVYKTQLDIRSYKKKQAYLETLPTVYQLMKRKKMSNAESKVRQSKKRGNGDKGISDV